MALVDKAAESLPPESDLQYTIMAESLYGGRPPDEPPLAGEIEELPIGHPDCLTGKTFVITGVLDHLTRDKAVDFIRRHGGKVTESVSGRTSFLIVGEQCGRSKIQIAKSKGTVKLINEAGLFALVKATKPPPALQQQQEEAEEKPSLVVAQQLNFTTAAPLRGSQQTQHRAVAQQYHGGDRGGGGGQLWVEKWRPRNSKELVGNNQIVTTLRLWLQEWEDVHERNKEPTQPPGARGKEKANDMKKKAVMLSGPPGIGKTSAALIISRELGYDVVEVNASDTRSKADASVLKGVGGKVANSIKELTTNTSIEFTTPAVGAGGAGSSKYHQRSQQEQERKKLVLIMDEVDGMSAGDRGGVADLIKTIAKSRIPIITICNDKYSPKLRSLRTHCMELDFRKPTAQQIAKRMMDIARDEGLQVNQQTMEALVQSANGGDIRLILGQLQMIRLRARALTYDQVRGGGAGSAKDLEMSPFEAARRLLDGSACANTSLADQIELVFQDADLVPLLVQENYLNHRPNIASDDLTRMRVIAKAAEGFSAGDVVNRSVRQYQNWALMPFAAAMGTVNPATYVRGSREIFGIFPGEANFPRFTAWLGQNSSSGKQRRLLGELHTRMLASGSIECDRTAVRLNYLPVLRNILTKPLLQRGKEGIPEVLALMNEYCISREDIEFVADVTKFKTRGAWGADPYKTVETLVKSAFTRAFNQQHLMPKTGFGMEEGKKKKGKKGGGGAAEEEEEAYDELTGGGERGGGGGGGAGEEEEDEEMDPLLLNKTLMKMKHEGMSVTLKDGTKGKKGGVKGGRGRRGGRGSGGRGKK